MKIGNKSIEASLLGIDTKGRDTSWYFLLVHPYHGLLSIGSVLTGFISLDTS